MAKIYVTRKIPDSGIKLLKKAGHTVRIYAHDKPITRKELLKNVKGVDAILSLLTDRIDAGVVKAAGSQLKIVANYAVGYDNIDVEALKKAGVKVANTPGVLNGAVAEHAIALLMATAKRIPEADAFIRAGKYVGWKPMLLLGTELAGKTLGIIGTGRIGFGVARRAAAMGIKIAYVDVRKNLKLEKEFGAKKMSLDRLLKTSDFVSLHVPLLPSTRHLIGAKQLRMMKKTAILINTSRGPVIDEVALVRSLKSARIAAAGLDVFEHEPKLAPGLKKLKNVVLTPHTASATVETRQAMSELAGHAIIDVLKGKIPKNLV